MNWFGYQKSGTITIMNAVRVLIYHLPTSHLLKSQYPIVHLITHVHVAHNYERYELQAPTDYSGYPLTPLLPWHVQTSPTKSNRGSYSPSVSRETRWVVFCMYYSHLVRDIIARRLKGRSYPQLQYICVSSAIYILLIITTTHLASQ